MPLFARTAAVVAACLAVLASYASLVASGLGGLLVSPLDFTAFRCGGLLVAAGLDPYRVVPLRPCEASALLQVGKHLTPHLVVPTPLPPYSLLPFALFGPLVPPLPSQIWAYVLLFALLATCLLLRPAVRGPLVLLALPLVAADFLASLVVGQLIPIEIALIAAALWCLRSGRYAGAALAAAGSMLEPNIGLPVCIGLALWEPRSRWPLAISLGAVGALSLVPGGPRLDIEYITRVLPEEALTEGLDAGKQFGLSAQLALAGVSAPLSMLGGGLSYVLMIVLGVRTGRGLARKFDEPSFAVATPPAFALIGGPYVHIHQVAAVLPLALLLYGRIEHLRVLLLVTIVLLGTPWQTIAELSLYQPLPPEHLIRAEHLMDLVDDEDAPAAGVWGMWVAVGGHTTTGAAVSMVEKTPTWLGLLALLLVALRAVHDRAPGRSRLRTRIEPLEHAASP